MAILVSCSRLNGSQGRMAIFCNKLSKPIRLLQWTNELCKQSIPWEPLTHAKLQSPGLELPARPSNCLQVPGETTKRSNCEEMAWECSLKTCHFEREGSDTIHPVPSAKSLVLYGWDIKKTNKQEPNNSEFRC